MAFVILFAAPSSIGRRFPLKTRNAWLAKNGAAARSAYWRHHPPDPSSSGGAENIV
jgi:hypothetical protein